MSSLELADSVTITFKMQKNDSEFDTMIHGRTNNPVLCPVLQWARLTNQIWSYEGTMQDTLVCTFQHSGGQLNTITSLQVLTRLQAAARSVASTSLGFELKEIGTHSLHSGAAMEMYLAGVPVHTIMLIGIWSSDACLHYIRKQVEQLSCHVEKQMLTF